MFRHARQSRSARRSIIIQAPETPGKQRRCIAPYPRFAVAEDDDDDVAAWSRPAANQAMPSGLRVTGFHTVTVRKPPQNLVGVFEFTGPAVGIAKNKLWKTNNRPDCRIGIRRTSDN